MEPTGVPIVEVSPNDTSSLQTMTGSMCVSGLPSFHECCGFIRSRRSESEVPLKVSGILLAHNLHLRYVSYVML